MAVKVDPAQLAEMAETMHQRSRRTDARQLETQRSVTANQLQMRLQQLGDLYKQLAELEEQIAAVAAGQDAGTEKFVEQLQRIAKLEQVRHVEVDDVGLQVYTNNIVSQPLGDGRRRLFGAFRLTITWGGVLHMECTNKKEVKDPTQRDNTFYDYEHPHVFSARTRDYTYPRANICFGNIGRQVSEYAMAGDYDVAASLCIQFLEEFTEHHSYNARAWKVYEPGAEPALKQPGIRQPVAKSLPITWEYRECPGTGVRVDADGWGTVPCPQCGTQARWLLVRERTDDGVHWTIGSHGQMVEQQATAA